MLRSFPTLGYYSFKNTVTEIDVKPLGDPQVAFPVLADAWPAFWRHGQWNELRARIVGGQTPTVTTWINGVKISEGNAKADAPKEPAPSHECLSTQWLCVASILNGSKGNGDGGIVSLPQTCL